ncbi:MAG: hypothetical protein ABI617_05715, partial [Sphingomicrobium sp.]
KDRFVPLARKAVDILDLKNPSDEVTGINFFEQLAELALPNVVAMERGTPIVEDFPLTRVALPLGFLPHLAKLASLGVALPL